VTLLDYSFKTGEEMVGEPHQVGLTEHLGTLAHAIRSGQPVPAGRLFGLPYTEPDPLHLALVFNLSHTTASRYAAIAQDLLDDQIEQATGQRPADQRYASDQPTEIPGPQPR
jgi:hypothetical protein